MPPLVRGLNVFYFVGALPAAPGCSSSGSTAARGRRSGLFRNGFLAATAIALLVALALPDGAAARSPASASRTRCASFSDIDIGSPGIGALSDPVAAVPSLHAGWALGVGVGLVLYARPLFWKVLGVALPGRRRADDVATGNHFILDALAGVLVMALGFAVAALPSGETVLDLCRDAGWSSQVARRAHNPEVAGSNPAPAMK